MLSLIVLSATFLLAVDSKLPRDEESNTFRQDPPVLVDPILCSELYNQTEWNEVDQYLMQLCRKKRVKGNHRFNVTTKREVRKTKCRLTPSWKQMLLDLHNFYRSQVSPSAADMKFMKWDEDLADLAQEWADKCEFKHGRPFGAGINFGQNLYAGPDKVGDRAIRLWFDEYEFYDYDMDECEDDEQCGHYVQLAWAVSDHLGCAVTKCLSTGYLFVCHYAPRGNHPDVRPYLVGAPCSQCRNAIDGGLCYNNTCVTKKECARYNLKCYCNLHCHNCAVLTPNNCRCICKRGWDSLDCSKACNDEHVLCGEDPGFPDFFSCSSSDSPVREEFCRKMCKQCEDTNEDDNFENEMEYCCQGSTCDEGMILDNSTCQCVDLCPGPICLGGKNQIQVDDSEASKVASTFYHKLRDETTNETKEENQDDVRDDDVVLLGSRSSTSLIKPSFIYIFLGLLCFSTREDSLYR